MPLVRIDMRRGSTVEFKRQVSETVYDALLGFGAPEDDRFQVIAEHEPEAFVYAPNYLGIERTAALVMIQITAVAGRDIDQKRRLYLAIANGLHAAVGLRREDVLINLVEVPKENWSFGLGLAQYAL